MDAKKGLIIRQDVPPTLGRYLQLKKVAAKEVFVATICSPGWVGVPTHYVGGRTIPHVLEKKNCEGCKLRRRIGWYGYLHLCFPEGRGQFVLGFTALACEYLDKVRDNRPNLRGIVVSVARENQHPKGCLKFDFVGMVPDPEKLPVPYDPLITMYRLWGISNSP